MEKTLPQMERDLIATLPEDQSVGMYLINVYFSRYYRGNEHFKVIQSLYTWDLWLDLEEWMAKNRNKTELKGNIFTHFDFKARINAQKGKTLAVRKRVLNEWKTGVIQHPLAHFFANLYPRATDIDFLKVDLGLN